MDIDCPEVVAEVKATFERYERALMSNDVATLNTLFHTNGRTIRYGIAEIFTATRRLLRSVARVRRWGSPATFPER